jgi:hypothetical protein
VKYEMTAWTGKDVLNVDWQRISRGHGENDHGKGQIEIYANRREV